MTQEEFNAANEKFEQAKKLVKKISDLKHFLEEVDGKIYCRNVWVKDLNQLYVDDFIERYLDAEKISEVCLAEFKRQIYEQLETAEQEFAELEI